MTDQSRSSHTTITSATDLRRHLTNPFAWALGLSVLGLLLSSWLLAGHLGGGVAGCGGGGCNEVLNSPWAYFPPALGDAAPAGVPVAMLAVAHFAVLTAWFALIGAPSSDRRAWMWVPKTLAVVGCVMAGWYLVLMLTAVGSLCPLCLGTHLVSIALGILVLAGASMTADPAKTEAEGAAAPVSHPSHRLAVATLLIGVTAAFGAWQFARAAQLNQQSDQLRQVVRMLSGDQANPGAAGNGAAAAIQPSAHARAEDQSVRIAMFHDLHCGPCSRYEQQLFDRIVPLFDSGEVRVELRHYPLDQSCNPKLSRSIHEYACDVAELAEAVRIAGDDRAYLQARDQLKSHHDPVTEQTVRTLALQLDLDAEQLIETWRSDEPMQRITRDIEHARQHNVSATPTVVVNGRKLTGGLRGNMQFWRSLAAGRSFGKAHQNATGRRAAQPETDSPQPASEPQPKKDQPHPLQPGEQLQLAGPTLSGEQLSLASMRGDPVLVMFWASWCPYCRNAMDQVVELENRFADEGLEVLGVSLDKSRADLERYLAEHELDWPLVFFPDAAKQGWNNPLARANGVRAIPTFALVDASGQVVQVGSNLNPIRRHLANESEPTAHARSDR